MAGIRTDKIFISDENSKTSLKEVSLVTGAKLIQSELNFLFSIKKHSLFFGNDIGIDLERYLYLLNTQATFNLIKSEIEDLLKKYGKVYLHKIEMNFNKTRDTLQIHLDVSETNKEQDIIPIPINLGGGQ